MILTFPRRLHSGPLRIVWLVLTTEWQIGWEKIRSEYLPRPNTGQRNCTETLQPSFRRGRQGNLSPDSDGRISIAASSKLRKWQNLTVAEKGVAIFSGGCRGVRVYRRKRRGATSRAEATWRWDTDFASWHAHAERACTSHAAKWADAAMSRPIIVYIGFPGGIL